jgi:hypothetical protein
LIPYAHRACGNESKTSSTLMSQLFAVFQQSAYNYAACTVRIPNV